MKKLLFANRQILAIAGLTLTSSLIISTSLFSQTYCGTSRYDTEIFSTVTTTTNVTYGQNTNINNNMQTLTMNIYEPTGDAAAMRPVIIFAHGGSFIGGAKTDAEQVTLCTRFAKRGYVTATIDYRLGMGFPINQTNAQKAVWRATQDMKAAVRFFRQDAATTNTYKADPNFIFVGGYSAGAFMAVHYAYLDQSSEIPAAIDTNQLGGLEGNSGNPGYCSAINGVINLAGAVGDSLWMQPGDEPMVTAQGDNDGTVPYCTAMIYVSGFPIMVVSGGGSMQIRCFNIGICNPIHTYYGQGHSADISTSPNNMDSTIALISDFVYKQIGCTPSGNPANYINVQTCVPGAGGQTCITTAGAQTCLVTGGVDEFVFNESTISIHPNPTKSQFTVKSSEFRIRSLEIYNVYGERVYQTTLNSKQGNLNLQLPSGMYFMKCTSEENKTLTTKIIFTE